MTVTMLTLGVKVIPNFKSGYVKTELSYDTDFLHMHRHP